MKTKSKQVVCPVENAGSLDHSFRKLLQNPERIVKPYINTGDVVMDMGCGPGFFTLPMARWVGKTGKVIAVDLQKGMLDKLHEKTANTSFEERILRHQCKENKVGVTQKVDFILAFYMVHEVPDPGKLLEELKSILNPEGKLLIAEPKFHVKKADFNKMLFIIQKLDFKVIDRPKIFFSRSVVLQNS